MKNLILITLTTLVLIICKSVSAQTFGGPLTFTGTTNAVLLIGGVPQTNAFSFTIPPKNLWLYGVSNTNETFIGSYGIQIVTATSTNLVILASMTNSFASGTNSGTWMTNFPSVQISFSPVTIMQAGIGANTNQIYVP